MKRILKSLIIITIVCIMAVFAVSCEDLFASTVCPGCNQPGGVHKTCGSCHEYFCVGDHTECNKTETETKTCPGCKVEGEEHGKCEVCEEYLCVGDHAGCSKDILKVCPACNTEGEDHGKCEKCKEYVCVGDHTECNETETETNTCPGCNVEGDEHQRCAFCLNYVCVGDHTECNGDIATICPGCKVAGEEHGKCEVCEEYLCVGEHSDCGKVEELCPGCKQSGVLHDLCHVCKDYLCAGSHDKCYADGVCEGCKKPGETHPKCDVCKEYVCVGSHYECYPNEPCTCGGGTVEGNKWMHAKCPECERYLCDGHELCANCKDYVGCASYCSSCNLHHCYHPTEICSHCNGYLSWCQEGDKLSQLREHYTLCTCGKYRCEGYDYDHEECDKELKNCPECHGEGLREEHDCYYCDGYICDGSDKHDRMCPSCSEFICTDESIHGKFCERCKEPLCQGNHTNCEPKEEPDDNGKPKECNHVKEGGTLKFYEKKDPTCEERGWLDHYVCDVCHWYFSEDGSTTGIEHDKLIYIGVLSCTDNNGDGICEYCNHLILVLCPGCGSNEMHEKCECGMYVCMTDHEFICTVGKGDGNIYCPGCGRTPEESAWHDACGSCEECCTCESCSHDNYSSFIPNCGYNIAYEHVKCNDCNEVFYLIYTEIGIEKNICEYCDPNAPKCGHDSMSTLYMEDIHCESGLIHYACSECKMVFLYSEDRGAYVCGICGDYSISNRCDGCHGASESICGVCSRCPYCCGCIKEDEDDKENQKLCTGCYNAVTSLCERCSKCSDCCLCSERVDMTQYCPRCATEVTVSPGFDASCYHPGMRDTYNCQNERCGYNYIIINGQDVYASGDESPYLLMIDPYGHADSDGNYACDRCKMLYTNEYCVFCGGTNPCFGCMYHYDNAVSPIEWGGVKKYQTAAGNWIKIQVWYNRGQATLTYSIRYNYGEGDSYTDYCDIVSISYEASFVTSEKPNYVLALRPLGATVYARNLLDLGWDSSIVESFGIDTEKITYIMLTRSQTNYEDNVWAPNDNYMGVILNLPFEVCSYCDGLADLGGHGVCDIDGCGKNCCAGHVHGMCDHENAYICDPKCYDCIEHYYCPDCDTYFRMIYMPNGYILEECMSCEYYKENEDESFGA